jgi:6-phosphofructo-2-kinase/fructose-2,6-biphosphatase 4
MGLPVDESKKLVVWTSARRRSYHTAWPFVQLGHKVVEKPQMSEINPGIWDGLSPELLRERFPDEWERFLKDPYAHRAPRAESYHDLCVRLEPILIELEREQEDLLIIGHASVIRCLLAYLVGLPASEIPAVEIARGDLVEVVPASYGVHSQAYHFWSGPGRGTEGADGTNFYENYAEATEGKRKEGVEQDEEDGGEGEAEAEPVEGPI